MILQPIENRLANGSNGKHPVSAARVDSRRDRDRLAQLLEEVIGELGVDVRDAHLRETPQRVAKALLEQTRGYREDPRSFMKTFESKHRDVVVVSRIPFTSLCPHHMMVYRGSVDFGYVPDGRIVGLSKIPRLVHNIAARLIVQEDLVNEIADTFMTHVQPEGCVVIAAGRHDCVSVRGARTGALMRTRALRGSFRTHPAHMDEFMQLMQLEREGD